MPQTHAKPSMAALVALLAAACAGDRDRPGADPLGPPAGPIAFAEIVHPRENQIYLRATFSQPPGVQITFSGQYGTGHQLLVLAFSDVEPLTPFFAARTVVQGSELPRNAWILSDAIQMEGVAEAEILLRVLDGRDRNVSTDSVGVLIR